MSIVQFSPNTVKETLANGERAKAGEQFFSDPTATSLQTRKAFLIEELRHFLHRKNALMNEVQRQFLTELNVAVRLLASQSRATDHENVERPTAVFERAPALERLMSQLHYISEQKIAETEHCLKLLYNRSPDFPFARTFVSIGEPVSATLTDVPRGFLLAWLVDDDITETSVTCVDLTNIFDRRYDSLSVDLN